MTLKPLPTPSLDTEQWWEELAVGVVKAPKCGECKELFFPPQPFCPRCGSAAVELHAIPPNGRVYSWVTTHRPFDPAWVNDVPYAIVAVDMEAGSRLIGPFLGPATDVRAGLEVVAHIYESRGQALLGFMSAGSAVPDTYCEQ